MKNINILFLFVLATFSGMAQCGLTAFHALPYDAVVRTFEVDSDEHLYVGLHSNNSTTLLKMDNAKNILNSLSMGSSISSWAQLEDIAIDKDNNIYLCGSFETYLYLGPGHSYSASGVSSSIFTAKLDHNFQPIWSHISDGPSSASAEGDDRAKSISVDTLGGVFFSVKQKGPFQFQGQDYSVPLNESRTNMFKINENTGLVEWVIQQPNGPSWVFPSLEVNQGGGFYEVITIPSGYTDEFGTFYSAGQTPNYYNNTLIFFYDNAGVRQWDLMIRGGDALAHDIDTNGDLLVMTRMKDTLIVGLDTLYSLDKTGMYVGRIDMNGSVVSHDRVISSAYSNNLGAHRGAIESIADKGFLITGWTYEQTNFNGIVRNPSDPDPSDVSFFAARFDSTYTPVWAKIFGNGETKQPYGIRSFNDCSAYFLGYAHNQFEYDAANSFVLPFEFRPVLIEFGMETGALGIDSIASGGGVIDDPFGQNGTNGANLSVYEELLDDFKVYPNPVNDKLMIGSDQFNEYQWILLDDKGRILENGIGSGISQLNLSDYSSGVYIVKVSLSENDWTFKKRVIKI